MANAFEVKVKGIKCDACDYRDDNVTFEEYTEYLNKPCPKCGANLLTDEDLKAVQKLIERVNLVNQIFPKYKDDATKIEIPLHMDGSGRIY